MVHEQLTHKIGTQVTADVPADTIQSLSSHVCRCAWNSWHHEEDHTDGRSPRDNFPKQPRSLSVTIAGMIGGSSKSSIWRT